jgi:hypothetical protein
VFRLIVLKPALRAIYPSLTAVHPAHPHIEHLLVDRRLRTDVGGTKN